MKIKVIKEMCEKLSLRENWTDELYHVYRTGLIVGLILGIIIGLRL